MSECVVRMEMPNGCHDCKLRNMVGNCPIPMFDGQDEEKIWTLAECFQRPPWCPILFQLPEGHGRLVDVDKLSRDISLKVCLPCPFGEEKECKDCVIEKVMNRIDDAPTIVPAKDE